MLKSHSTHRVARRWMNVLTGMMLLSVAGLAIALDPTPEQTPAEPFTVAMDVQIDEGSKSRSSCERSPDINESNHERTENGLPTPRGRGEVLVDSFKL